MIRLVFKLCTSTLFVLLFLELMVRVFHLHSDMPERYINADGVELNLPHQEGLFVTGNRRQHAVPYKTDAYGFNTLQNNRDAKTQKTIALIGDSFIEGFHQPRSASLGKMIEEQMQNTMVTEYGISGYDFADQLYLVHTYKQHFEQIDALVFYIKYENDFERATYEPDWLTEQKNQSRISKFRKESKLLSYMGGIGVINQFSRFLKRQVPRQTLDQSQSESLQNSKLAAIRVANFKALLEQYPIPLSKVHLLLNTSKTHKNFLDMCKKMGIPIIDFKDSLQQTEANTTYIYDEHWNQNGRLLVADKISKHFN